MSENPVQALLRLAEENSALREHLHAADSPDQVVALAAENGLTLSKAQAIRMRAEQIQQLSDDDLENLAGGGFFSHVGHSISHDAGQMVHNTKAAGQMTKNTGGDLANTTTGGAC
jgi:predicted ribosomally synthesized peptide with nif11-like leader